MEDDTPDDTPKTKFEELEELIGKKSLENLIGFNETQVRYFAKIFHDLMLEAMEAINESGAIRRAWAKACRYGFQELQDEGFTSEQAMEIMIASIGQLKSPQLRK